MIDNDNFYFENYLNRLCLQLDYPDELIKYRALDTYLITSDTYKTLIPILLKDYSFPSKTKKNLLFRCFICDKDEPNQKTCLITWHFSMAKWATSKCKTGGDLIRLILKIHAEKNFTHHQAYVHAIMFIREIELKNEIDLILKLYHS